MALAYNCITPNPCPNDFLSTECSENDEDPHMISPSFTPSICAEDRSKFSWNNFPPALPHPVPESLAITLFSRLFRTPKFPLVSVTRVPSTCSIQFNIRNLASQSFIADIYPHNPPGTCSYRRAFDLQWCVHRLYLNEPKSKRRNLLSDCCPTYHITILPKVSWPTFASLIHLSGGPFALPVVFKLAIGSLLALERVHRSELVHGNVCPHNFHVDRDRNGKYSIVLSEFHHLQLMDNRPGSPLPRHFCVGRSHNNEYSSVEVQNRHRVKLKDDLQSWIYVVVFLAKGRIPWEGESWKNMADMKLDLSSEGVFAGVPRIFKGLFKEFREMDKDFVMDYDHIRECLRRTAPDHGVNDGWPW